MTDANSVAGASRPKGRRAAIVFILITVWIDVLSWGVTIPVYPRLFESFTNGNVSQAAALVAAFMTLFAVIQLFAAPVLGALSDHFGRRPVILIACLGLGLDLFAMALMTVAPNFWILLATRVIHAVTAASNSAAMAYVADVTEPQDRAKSFGYMGAAFGVGFIVGPGLGGVLGGIHLGLPFLVGGVLAMLNFAYGFFVLPESLPPERRRKFEIKEANPFGVMKFLTADKVLLALAGVLFAATLAQQVYPSVWVLYTQYRYNWGPMAVGLTLAASGVLSAIVQTTLVAPIVKRIGERRAVILGYSMWAIGCIVGALATQPWMFLCALPLGSLAGVAGPSLSAIMSRRVSADRQGELQGANSSMQSLTGIIGPTLFAGSFAYTTSAGALFHVPGAPLFIAAALLVLAVVLASSATRHTEAPASAPA